MKSAAEQYSADLAAQQRWLARQDAAKTPLGKMTAGAFAAWHGFWAEDSVADAERELYDSTDGTEAPRIDG